MIDALKTIANDAGSDRRVKKKLTLVLGSWRDQYKDDPAMSVTAGLYRQVLGHDRRMNQELAQMVGIDLAAEEKKKAEKVEAKAKLKQAEKEAKERREQRAKKGVNDANKKKRVPFDFEKVCTLFMFFFQTTYSNVEN